MGITNHELHDKDFYAWTKETAQLLKDGRVNEVDIINIADEIEELGISDDRALFSQLSRLIAHLLKWQYQPSFRGNSWKNTIEDARIELKYFMDKSKLLKKEAYNAFEKAYQSGIRKAVVQTGLDKKTFPETPLFTLDQCLDENFWPE